MDMTALTIADRALRRHHRPTTNMEFYGTVGMLIGYFAGKFIIEKFFPDMEPKKAKNAAIIPGAVMMIIGGIIGFKSEH